MDLISGADYRRRTNLGMLETMQDPRNGPDVLPPNQYHNTSFSKDVVVIGTWVVDDSAIGSSTCRVPTSTGIVLWLTAWGTNSIYRMGFVPSGIACPAAVRGLNMELPWSSNAQSIVSITFNNPFPLPYGVQNSFPEDQINITGDLERTFNIVRPYSGIISLRANTISTTNFAFNGTVAAGAIADTRDIAQHVITGDLNSGTRTSYSEADLQQTSVTKKDAVVQGSLLRGVTALLASDIQPDYVSPNPSNDYKYSGEYATFPLSNVTFASVVSVNGAFDHLFQAGVSVADITWNQNGALSFPSMDQYRLGAIGELDQLAFLLHGHLMPDTPGAGGALYELNVTAQHVFAVVQSDHEIYWHTVKETKSALAHANAGINPQLGSDFSMSFDPFFGFDSFTTTGKYVGTIFSGILVSSSLSGGYAGNTINITDMAITCIAKQLNIRGSVGYARILRYDNVSNTVNMRVEGKINIQCVPQGNLAPYVKGEAATHDQAVDLNCVPLAALCWNGNNSLFRRIWVSDEYEQMLQDGGAQLDPEKIVMAIKDSPAAVASAQAAGIFDWLKGAAETVGHAVAPIARPVVQGLLGAAADRAVGALANRFGGGSASGQFGQAAGQFGYSAGQFSGMRRLRSDTLSQYR